MPDLLTESKPSPPYRLHSEKHFVRRGVGNDKLRLLVRRPALQIGALQDLIIQDELVVGVSAKDDSPKAEVVNLVGGVKVVRVWVIRDLGYTRAFATGHQIVKVSWSRGNDDLGALLAG